MKVGELIKRLERHDPNDLVVVETSVGYYDIEPQDIRNIVLYRAEEGSESHYWQYIEEDLLEEGRQEQPVPAVTIGEE